MTGTWMNLAKQHLVIFYELQGAVFLKFFSKTRANKSNEGGSMLSMPSSVFVKNQFMTDPDLSSRQGFF